MKRRLAERSGREGERRAAFWLRAKGWRIVAERVKTPRGEIDLVAKRGGLVAFVEVKWRRKGADLDLAIDEYRLGRVAAAVDKPEHRKDTAKHVAQWVRSGLTIERVPVDDARKALKKCEHYDGFTYL